MTSKHPIHLLLRFSDVLLKDSDTIDEHNQVVQRAGAVLFGKMGSPVSQHYIDLLNKQIEDGIPTYLYLVKGNRRKSTAHRSQAISLSKVLPENDTHLVPPYYLDLDIMRYMKCWVKVTTIYPITAQDLNSMRVASSVLPIGETLVKSSTGHFFITEGKAF